MSSIETIDASRRLANKQQHELQQQGRPQSRWSKVVAKFTPRSIHHVPVSAAVIKSSAPQQVPLLSTAESAGVYGPARLKRSIEDDGCLRPIDRGQGAAALIDA